MLAFGYSVRLQHRAGAAELAALRQSTRYSALSFQCSTTQKGMSDQKPDRWHLTRKFKYPDHTAEILMHTGSRYSQVRGFIRHCEGRSDVAISKLLLIRIEIAARPSQ